MTRTDYLPGLELVKLLALAAMLIDHADLILAGRSMAWTYEVGRFALPAFFGAYAVGLARATDPGASVGRLISPAVLAHFAWSLTDAAPAGLNVLFVAAYLASTVSVLRSSTALGLALAGTGFAVWPMIEGGWVTLAVFWSSYAAASTSRPVLALIGAGPVFAVTPGLAGLAGLAAPHLAHYLPGVRRGLVPFAWVYAAHLSLLAAISLI